MTRFAIEPTVTQRVREFLAAQGVKPAPWAPLDEVYVELHTLLRSRREDPAFWGPLEELLGQVVEAAVDPSRPGRLPAPQAELLSAADVGELARDLRRALGEGGSAAGSLEAVRRFTAGASAAVLAGFLLLGVAAAGCSSESRPVSGADDRALTAPPSSEVAATPGEPAGGTQPAAPGPEAGPPAEVVAAQDAAPEPACRLDQTSALWRAVDGAALDDPAKLALCQCLAGASESWSEGLTQLFERGTPRQVAAALERLLTLCETDGALAGDFETVDDPALRLRRPVRFVAQPAYRGVSF